MNENIKFILDIVSAVVSGKKEYPKPPQNVNWSEIFRITSEHNIANIIAYGINGAKYNVPENIKSAFKKRMFTDLYLDECQKKQAPIVYSQFEKYGLLYMPVKGFSMKKMYPSSDMRRMSDMDILVKKDEMKKYADALYEEGFSFVRDKENEFVVEKGLVTIELHRYLITPGNDDMFSYYETGWNIAQKSESESRCFLSREDEFVYLLCHFVKHYRNAGAGIKPIIDIWLYKKINPDIDFSYINAQIEKMGLTVFIENLYRLIDAWFENGAYDELIYKMTNYIFASGEYGITSNNDASSSIRAGLSRKGTFKERLSKLMKLVFLDKNRMKKIYPILNKFIVLLPFCWLHRIIKIVLFRQDKITEKKVALENNFGSNVDRFERHMKEVGIDVYRGSKK